MSGPVDDEIEASTDEPDDEIITCWCGAQGTFDELFDDAVYGESCGGDGFLYCLCGGDLCVCHHHGQEVECPGCPDCEFEDDDHYGPNPADYDGPDYDGHFID